MDNDKHVEMPQPTVAPFVLAVGVTMLALGVVFGPAFVLVGAAVLVAGLALWIKHLLPGAGHQHESLAQERPAPIDARRGAVERLERGMPGYRLRLPVEVHPISAGVRGGIVGGLIMPLPALLYGLVSGKGIWYPVNLLAGMVLPGVESMANLGDFHLSLFVIGVGIHAVISVILGLLYGVLLPTLPPIPRPLAWGGLLMPLLWTVVTFTCMRFVNPLLGSRVDWPWFIASQFVFGVVAAAVVMRCERLPPLWAGLLGGAAGGLLMPVLALLWSLLNGHSIWYPLNLLVGLVGRGLGDLTTAELERFELHWLITGVAVHAALSLGLGIVYGVLLPRLRPIPGAMAWGALLLPLLWTGTSYGLMGVVNPLLQDFVDWPWFIVSQFVFGLAASIVVVRSEKIPVPPKGRGETR